MPSFYHRRLAEADKQKKDLDLKSPSEGHKPKNKRAAAAVHALGRTKVTGNFKKIEKAKGKGARHRRVPKRPESPQGITCPLFPKTRECISVGLNILKAPKPQRSGKRAA